MTNIYPPGTRFGDYYLAKEANSYAIKRNVTFPTGRRSSMRLSKATYDYTVTKDSLQRLILRLNGRENRKAIVAIETKLAFLPTPLMEEFRELLEMEIPNQTDARSHYRNLHRYFLKFFIETLKLKDPLEWKANEHKWGISLLHEGNLKIFDEKKSLKTIKKVTQVANRFMSFLHRKLPKEVPFIKFEPISKARLNHYNAVQTLDSDNTFGLFITENDWITIEATLPKSIAPFIKLGYYYGLRRSETLGFEPHDLAVGHLNVVRQLKSINLNGIRYKPLKGRNKRKTPHWFITPKLTYTLIQECICKKMHPDTLSGKFNDYLKQIQLTKYSLHDLRRTFITTALDYYTPKEVMLAVGHASIEITMKYIRDDRNLQNTLYIPDDDH